MRKSEMLPRIRKIVNAIEASAVARSKSSYPYKRGKTGWAQRGQVRASHYPDAGPGGETKWWLPDGVTTLAEVHEYLLKKE